MPRHTLHRLTRDLAELVGPEVSAASPQGRFPAERVDGQRLTGVDAFTCTWDAREVAALRPGDGPGLSQVRLRLAVPELAWGLIAPSTCELLDAARRAELVGRLGPDPLRSDRDPDEAYRRVVAHRGTIATALLD